MVWTSVSPLLSISGFSSAEEASIRSALEAAYTNSVTAATILDKIPAANKQLTIEKVAGAFQAIPWQ